MSARRRALVGDQLAPDLRNNQQCSIELDKIVLCEVDTNPNLTGRVHYARLMCFIIPHYANKRGGAEKRRPGPSHYTD